MRPMRRAGQAATEYMLVVSVLVVAVVASAYVFVPEFQSGVAGLSADVSRLLALGSIDGVGFGRGTPHGLGQSVDTAPNSGGASNVNGRHLPAGSGDLGSGAVMQGNAPAGNPTGSGVGTISTGSNPSVPSVPQPNNGGGASHGY